MAATQPPNSPNLVRPMKLTACSCSKYSIFRSDNRELRAGFGQRDEKVIRWRRLRLPGAGLSFDRIPGCSRVAYIHRLNDRHTESGTSRCDYEKPSRLDPSFFHRDHDCGHGKAERARSQKFGTSTCVNPGLTAFQECLRRRILDDFAGGL